MTPFSVQLQNLRRSRGLRQKTLAGRLGMDQANLSALENAHRPPPRGADFYERLRSALELSDEEYSDLKRRAEATLCLGKVVSGATPTQIRVALQFYRCLQALGPAQLRAIEAILAVRNDFNPTETMGAEARHEEGYLAQMTY